MVTRRRLRSFFTALGLYAIAALFIGYFAVNAFSGNHGLVAKQQLEEQIAELTAEFGRVEVERLQWERRVSLLRSDRLDPDLLDERARA
jgi:cell division protein FtsB